MSSLTEDILRNAIAQQAALQAKGTADVTTGAGRMWKTIAAQAAARMKPEDRDVYLRGLGVDEDDEVDTDLDPEAPTPPEPTP